MLIRNYQDIENVSMKTTQFHFSLIPCSSEIFWLLKMSMHLDIYQSKRMNKSITNTENGLQIPNLNGIPVYFPVSCEFGGLG